MILKKGQIINNTYTVRFFIGEGAFGEVYRVKHKFIGLQVLKILKPEYVERSDINAISKEALILSKLTHKNIVRVFELNTFELNDITIYFIAMEFISGESLSDLLKRKILIDMELSLKIQVDFLKGLKFAHLNNVIHRDINPDNILLSYRKNSIRSLLSDFGLAQNTSNLNKISSAKGRYLYMAPECFSNIYLPCSDVFSAGIVFYRMLTGVSPWEVSLNESDRNEDIIDKMVISRKKKPLSPSFNNPKIPKEIDNIILKSLSLKIEDRYKNGSEFLDVLKKVKIEMS